MKVSTTTPRPPPPEAWPASRSILQPGVVALLGFVGPLILGFAVAGGRGELALAGLAGLAAAVGLTVTYLLRPIGTVLGFWIFLLFQPLVVAILGKDGGLGAGLNKVENPVMILLLAVSVVNFSRRRPPGRLMIYLPAVGFLSAGLMSAALSRVAPSQALLAAFLGVKAYALLAITLLLPWTLDDLDRVLRFVLRFAVPVGVLAIIDFLAPGPFRALLGLSRTSDVRFGLESARGIFPIPALLSSFMFCALAVLLAQFCYRRRRSHLVAIAVLSLAAILSLRFKAIMGVGGAFAMVAAVNPKTFARRLGNFTLVGIAALVLGGSLILGVASRQISTYLTNDDETPRGLLFSTSYEIAKDRFPLGVGFGRFGSAPSENPYSPVYEQYGLSTVRGLSQEQPLFINDTSWATVLGESGLIGLLFYTGGFLAIAARLLLQARNPDLDPRRRMASLAGLTVLVVFLLDSLGRPAIFDAFTALTVGLFVGAGLALGGAGEVTSRSGYRQEGELSAYKGEAP